MTPPESYSSCAFNKTDFFYSSTREDQQIHDPVAKGFGVSFFVTEHRTANVERASHEGCCGIF